MKTTEDPKPLIRYEETTTRASWLKSRPTPGGHTAVVSLDSSGQLMLVRRRPTASEWFHSPPTGVFWVDVSVHHAALRFELPTAEGVFKFLCAADLSWRIGDPVQAVQDGVSNGQQIYLPYLKHQLRSMSRQFAFDCFAAAEQSINAYFAGRSVDMQCGITLLSCQVGLTPELETESHIMQRTLDLRNVERRDAEHRAQMHDAELKRDENETEHAVLMQSVTFGQEITELEERHRFSLERQRMDFYADTLRAGELGVLALRLASNRDDVNDVIQIMMNQKQLDFETARDMLNALLEQRLVNRKDAHDIMARATKVVADHWKQRPAAVVSAKAEPVQELTGSSMAGIEDADVVDESDEDEEVDEDEEEDEEYA